MKVRKKLTPIFKILCISIFCILLFVSACSKQPEQEQITAPSAVSAVDESIVPTLPAEPEQIIDIETNEGRDEEPVSVLTEPFIEPAVTPQISFPSPIIEQIEIFSSDFSQNKGDFASRGDARVVINNTDAREGASCLQVKDRKATWNGAMLDMTGVMTGTRRFSLSAWVKYNEGYENIVICATLEYDKDGYQSIGTVKAKKGEWAQLTGDVVIPEGTQRAIVFFETEWKSAFNPEDLCDIYVDSVVITEEIVTLPETEIPAIKERFADYFNVGSGVVPSDLSVPEIRDILIKHFKTLTCGNEMKPDYLLDHAATTSDPDNNTVPAVKFDYADIIMDFAAENGLQVRGHTLVWHSQTPRWLFTEGFSAAADAHLTDKETMLLRMEHYIRQVLEHFQTKYPGVVIAWDVVNEAIETNDRHINGYRVNGSLWYETVGGEFIEKAFEYARKYADPGVKLFYNDYGEYVPARMYRMVQLITALKDKGLVDGMGMQSHISMDSPVLSAYEAAIREYCKTGLEVHITELDMWLTRNDDYSFLKQAERYAELSGLYKKLRDEGLPITNVTVWGVIDNLSWLNAEGPNYPLLFDKYYMPKPAFWGFIGS